MPLLDMENVRVHLADEPHDVPAQRDLLYGLPQPGLLKRLQEDGRIHVLLDRLELAPGQRQADVHDSAEGASHRHADLAEVVRHHRDAQASTVTVAHRVARFESGSASSGPRTAINAATS